MFTVRTRNWNCNKTVLRLLSIVPHYRGDQYDDGDGKLCFQTSNKLAAYIVLAYWKMLSPLSGGITGFLA